MDWKQEMLWLTVLYRMLECGDSIPLDTAGTDYAFIGDSLQALHARGFLARAPENPFWLPTDKARALHRQLIGLYDQALRFDIFGTVNLAIELDDDNSDDGSVIYDDLFDPRFAEPETLEEAELRGTEDMRLAVILWVSRWLRESEPGQEHGLRPVDPHRVAFLQFLAEGRFRDENIWFDLKLGQPFAEVDEIVEGAYRFNDVTDDPGEVDTVMRDIYAAGMLEQRKREGRACPGCSIPLAAFELHTRREAREPLDRCPDPSCQHDLAPVGADDDGWVCPACNEPCARDQHFCMSCGARLDWRLPSVLDDEAPGDSLFEGEGTAFEGTAFDEGSGEYVWGDSHGYTPYGWYDPYDLVQDLGAFARLSAEVFPA